jgi:hypothetical protein
LFFNNASGATQEDMVAKYIEMSGIGDMLKSIPGEMDSLASQKNLTSKNPEIGNKVYQIMKETFDAKQAEKNMSTYLLRNTDQKFLGEMLQWLESPVAMKITKEEVNSSGPEKQSNMLRYLADMELNPPTQDRINAIQGVEQATQISELMTNIMLDIMKGMMESVTLALPEDKRESIDDGYEEFIKMKPTLKEAFRQQMILSSFYTYRNISNEELNVYTKFYESELGQKEITITGAALGDVLKQWFDDVAKTGRPGKENPGRAANDITHWGANHNKGRIR